MPAFSFAELASSVVFAGPVGFIENLSLNVVRTYLFSKINSVNKRFCGVIGSGTSTRTLPDYLC